MRTADSIKNSLWSVLSSIVTILANFISQAIFIRLLGSEYLGINGLFTSILTMLNIFELGIGSAIVFNLYKPISEKNEKQIALIMKFYKKTYYIISAIIFTTGLCVVPFLKAIVGNVSVEINIYLVYLIFLCTTACSYILSYKKNIIQANQKSYLIDSIHILYIIALNILQLIILFLTKNYYLYLLIKLGCQIVENIVCSVIANKMYPFLTKKIKESLDSETQKNIFHKVRGLMFHKVGGSVVNGTDNIIISGFLGVATVGMYSNYSTIINAVNTLFRQCMSALTPSVGNLLATSEEKNKTWEVFKKIRFINFLISCFSAICILGIITPFIKIWIGEQYLLASVITIVLVINYFQKMQRSTFNIFKDAAGIWDEDKFVPLIESLINIIASLIFVKLFGLAGVFLGTIISGLILWCYSYPKYVYKRILNKSYFEYFKSTIGYILLFGVLAAITYSVTCFVTFDNVWIQLIFNTMISLLLPNTILVIIFCKTENFKYCLNLVKSIFKKVKKV